MEEGMCYNCEERETKFSDGVLCDECQVEMWRGERTHHGTLDQRTVEELERANGTMD